MRPFLYHLADTFYTYERENFSKLLFVFPNDYQFDTITRI